MVQFRQPSSNSAAQTTHQTLPVSLTISFPFALVSRSTARLKRSTYQLPPPAARAKQGKRGDNQSDYTFDYRARVVSTKRHPRSGQTLTSQNNYVDNELFYTEDPYGRRTRQYLQSFTSQTFFDDDLTDNVGLDSSAGLSVPKLGGGTYNISISAVITKVADTPANGGAGVTFGNGVMNTYSYRPDNLVSSIEVKDGTGTAVYYHRNSEYSVSALTSASGGAVERYGYEPYGEVTILAADGSTVRASSSYANSYTYTGSCVARKISARLKRLKCNSPVCLYLRKTQVP